MSTLKFIADCLVMVGFLTIFFLRLALLEKVALRKKALLFTAIALATIPLAYLPAHWLQYPAIIGIMLLFLRVNDRQGNPFLFQLFIAVFTMLFCSSISFFEQTCVDAFFHLYLNELNAQIGWLIGAGFINILIVMLLPKGFYQKLSLMLFENRYLRCSLVLFTVLLFSFILYMNYPRETASSHLFFMHPFIFVAFIALGVAFSFGLMSYGFYSKQRKMQAEMNEQLLQYTHEVEELYDGLSMFRHDYLNILFSLRMAIQSKNIELVERIFEDTIAPTEKIINNQNYEITRLNRIGVPELKSLIYLKINSARAKNISVDLEIHDIVRTLPMDKLAFIRTLGILLDNAIENAEISEQKKLHIAILRNAQTLCFEISNSINNSNLDLHKIFLKGYTEKNTAKEKHGLGLHYVRNVVDASESASLETKIIDHTFIQSLQMKEES